MLNYHAIRVNTRISILFLICVCLPILSYMFLPRRPDLVGTKTYYLGNFKDIGAGERAGWKQLSNHLQQDPTSKVVAVRFTVNFEAPRKDLIQLSYDRWQQSAALDIIVGPGSSMRPLKRDLDEQRVHDLAANNGVTFTATY